MDADATVGPGNGTGDSDGGAVTMPGQAEGPGLAEGSGSGRLWVEELTARLAADRWYDIGFPGARDFDYAELAPLLSGVLLNNVGDPYTDGTGRSHSKDVERAVVEWVADVFRAPTDDRWGHVTPGGSYSNLYALRLARECLGGQPLVLYSAAAHYSIPKAVEILRLDSVVIRTDHTGQMDLFDLADQVRQHRHRAVVVVATVGTTMFEAVDNVPGIKATLDYYAMTRRWILVDAALSGIPLQLLPATVRPGFDFPAGADSIAVSGHKFPGSPLVCGVVVVRASDVARVGRAVGYTGSVDTTIGGSRDGHAPLVLWRAIQRHGVDGHRARAERSRELAAHTLTLLRGVGWEAWRHPHAFTVVLRTPPASVLAAWPLPSESGWSHLITMPGVVPAQISDFVDALEASTGAGTVGGVHVPHQRTAAGTCSAKLTVKARLI